MNELTLSNDIGRIETEIQFYKEQAGQSIWEIGRRLNHVKEHDLAHGQFGEWLKKINFSQDVANKFMRVAKELPSNSVTSRNLGIEAMYLITTLPEPEKQAELEKAEEGNPSTVRELRELKKQLKQKNQQIANLAESVEDLANQEPKVITKEVKVTPPDYESLKAENMALKRKKAELEGKIKLKQIKYDALEQSTAEATALRDSIKSLKEQELKIKTTIQLNEELNEINRFFEERMAKMVFKDLIKGLEVSDPIEKVISTVNVVDDWVQEMRKIYRPERKSIEGVIINE